MQALEHVLRQYERLLAGSTHAPEDSELPADKAGAYRYVPLEWDTFQEELDVAKNACEKQGINWPRFIDVGCGIGSKSLGAHFSGFDAYGIELNVAYAQIARMTLLADKVIIGDALEHDFSPYHVIYFYCPFRDRVKEFELEKHILTTARPGAIILTNLSRYEVWTPEHGKYISDYRGVYQKNPVEESEANGTQKSIQ